MNLVYGSILFLLHGLWGKFRLWVLPIRRSGVCLNQCSCVGAFVVDLIIIGCSSTDQPPSEWVLDGYPSYSLFLVSSAHYILLFVARCAYGGRVLLLALRSSADVAVFSPVSRIFSASLGTSVFFFGIFASIPWLRLWCSLFCSVCLFSAYLYPTVASLVCFSCGPLSLVVRVCVCVCVGFLSFCGGGAVSSSSPPAGCGVGSCWASFGVVAVPFPGAPAVFRSVSCSWLPFSGSAPIWLRLAGLLLQWTFIVGLAVSWYTTWFSTLC